MHPIRLYRTAKGWTQGELADKVGVNINTMQLWEKGACPRPRHIAKLAEVLGVDSLQLINEIEAWRREEAKAENRPAIPPGQDTAEKETGEDAQ